MSDSVELCPRPLWYVGDGGLATDRSLPEPQTKVRRPKDTAATLKDQAQSVLDALDEVGNTLEKKLKYVTWINK